MTAGFRRMAARRSSPCKLLIIVLHPNREHRRDAYATLGSASSWAEIRSIVPVGRGYFPHNPRHFVPGYYQPVPPGQKPFGPRAPRLKLTRMGVRPYLRRCAGTPRERIRFNLIRNKSLPVSPLLERFLDRSDLNSELTWGLLLVLVAVLGNGCFTIRITEQNN